MLKGAANTLVIHPRSWTRLEPWAKKWVIIRTTPQNPAIKVFSR